MVTSLIDYYELRSDFPGSDAAMAIENKMDSVQYLEDQLRLVIANDRFIPYIQLHEFEGVLFSDIRGFDYIRSIKPKEKATIRYIINHYPNPELINDGKTSAPSVRLASLISRYKKTFHGPIIALENGMQPVLRKCTRFKNWVDTIVDKFSDL